MEPLTLNLIDRELKESDVMNGKQEFEGNRQW